ncbi:MAG TPA: hypothetical protein PLE45_09355 [Spirochaetota bacterium]|nr:hypothetical protein [Spirochaetota bacterium]HOL57322.1 hypothetical protein [Spirochaetota bacterium]HPP04893.1 hypothetical protein [Spirochaetota bacterium]
MKKIYIFLIIVVNILLYSVENKEKNSYIDWVTGKIYSVITIYVKNDYNFPHKRLMEIEKAKDLAKINYYGILKNINISESKSVLDFFEETNKNSELFSLIDNAYLKKIEYPTPNTIRLLYYINIYGENSLISKLMNEKDFYTEDLRSYKGFNYRTNYTGVVIDARGILTSFDGYEVKVNPTIFITVLDNEGRLVFNQYNIYAKVLKEKGMVRYSYDINEDISDRVGNNPVRIVAFGTGDRNGSIIVISENDAKLLLSSKETKEAIQYGKIALIIDP